MRKITFFIFMLMILSSAVFARNTFVSEITEVSFPRKVLYADGPVIVWFYSGNAFVPFSKELGEYTMKKGKINIFRMDRAANSITSSKYKINKNNTFVFFVEGSEIVRTSSISSLSDYIEFCEHCMGEYVKIMDKSSTEEWVPSSKNNGKDSGSESEKN